MSSRSNTNQPPLATVARRPPPLATPRNPPPSGHAIPQFREGLEPVGVGIVLGKTKRDAALQAIKAFIYETRYNLGTGDNWSVRNPRGKGTLNTDWANKDYEIWGKIYNHMSKLPYWEKSLEPEGARGMNFQPLNTINAKTNNDEASVTPQV